MRATAALDRTRDFVWCCCSQWQCLKTDKTRCRKKELGGTCAWGDLCTASPGLSILILWKSWWCFDSSRHLWSKYFLFQWFKDKMGCHCLPGWMWDVLWKVRSECLENDKISFLSWEVTAVLSVQHWVPYSWFVLSRDLCHSYLCLYFKYDWKRDWFKNFQWPSEIWTTYRKTSIMLQSK